MTHRSINCDIVDKNLVKLNKIHKIFETHKDKKHKGFFDSLEFKKGYFKKLNQYHQELNKIVNFGRLYDKETKQDTSMFNSLIQMYNNRIDLINIEYRKKSIPDNLLLSRMQSIL